MKLKNRNWLCKKTKNHFNLLGAKSKVVFRSSYILALYAKSEESGVLNKERRSNRAGQDLSEGKAEGNLRMGKVFFKNRGRRGFKG